MRKLPVYVEQCVGEARRMQTQMASEFEQRVRADHTPVCRKGCSNCCHHPVLITVLEGIILYRELKAQGKWTFTLRSKLEHTRKLTTGLSLEVWLASNTPCPLLVDNQCSAYKARPTHCRTTFSVSDPYCCHPHSLGEGTGLLDNSGVVIKINTELHSMLKKHKVSGVIMPLSEAVLLGSKVDTGEIELDEVVDHFREHLNA